MNYLIPCQGHCTTVVTTGLLLRTWGLLRVQERQQPTCLSQ